MNTILIYVYQYQLLLLPTVPALQNKQWGLLVVMKQWRIQGGVGGLTPPPPSEVFFFFACQYMKIPADLDPNPPPPKNSGPEPPPPLRRIPKSAPVKIYLTLPNWIV